MKRAKTIAFAAGTMLLAAHGAIAQAQNTPGVMALTADEMRWSSQGGLALPGMEQVNLIGDPSKPGPYTLRLKFPAGFKLPPHFHPDAREVTIYRASGIRATAKPPIRPSSRLCLPGVFTPNRRTSRIL